MTQQGFPAGLGRAKEVDSLTPLRPVMSFQGHLLRTWSSFLVASTRHVLWVRELNWSLCRTLPLKIVFAFPVGRQTFSLGDDARACVHTHLLTPERKPTTDQRDDCTDVQLGEPMRF